MSAPAQPARHHVVIAGTGRAGTTFLVQFLAACGLDVGDDYEGISPDDLGPARAGLERYLLDENPPYVVKDPWLHTYCDAIDLDAVAVDALIIPVRDLLANTTSRLFQERIALVDSDWRNRPPVSVRGGADGGVVYSLDPVDEARILAVGFHTLVQWAISHEIPLFLLDFPRTVTDRDHLVTTLWPWLGRHCTEAVARAAFEQVARPEAVRFGDSSATTSPTRLSVEDLEIERRALAALLDQRDGERRTADEAAAQATHDRDLLAEELRRAQTELEQVTARLAATEAERADATAERDAMQRSVSWRLTAPLRAVRRRTSRGRDPGEVD